MKSVSGRFYILIILGMGIIFVGWYTFFSKISIQKTGKMDKPRRGRSIDTSVDTKSEELGEIMSRKIKFESGGLTLEGYLCIPPGEGPFPVPLATHLDDVSSDIEYVKELDYVGKTRIGLTGFSRGDLLTFMTAINRSDIQGFLGRSLEKS